jgi:2-keto-4-pentenoate hydratase/2-oxohepta-3-ene-1,7-dioic acid hydratase in catechol pathway
VAVRGADAGRLHGGHAASDPALIEHLSAAFTLEPGDLIATGTPAGVGAARTPPRFLRPGDVVRIEIDGLGVLENPVVAAR